MVSLLSLTLFIMPVKASVFYQASQDPWGETTNDLAMDRAFGNGNWTKSTYNINDFSNASFVFLDGGDSNAIELSNFISSHTPQIENYVQNGGRLFINAAPNEGENFSMGFDVTLNYSNGAQYVSATTEGIASGIFDGISTSYSGDSFSHSFVTDIDGKLVSFIDGEVGQSVFSLMNVGNGLAAFGGMTTTNFHQPQLDAEILRANMFTYVATSEVPIPAAAWLFGSALAGLGVVRRKK